MNRTTCRTQMRGITLVELMIAMTIGLAISGAVASVFLGSSRSFRTSAGLAQVQESGRFVSLLVGPVVRQAGYLPDPQISHSDPGRVFAGRLGKLAVYGTRDPVSALTGKYAGFDASRVVAGTQVLLITHGGRDTSTPADTPLRTCLGDAVDASQIAVNIFYITRPTGSSSASLNCYTNISTLAAAEPANATAAEGLRSGQPLVSGVSDMQVLYGVDSDGLDGIDRYLSADEVADWTHIASVQVTFTVESADPVSGTRDEHGADSRDDGRIRHRFTSTWQIRNRLRTG